MSAEIKGPVCVKDAPANTPAPGTPGATAHAASERMISLLAGMGISPVCQTRVDGVKGGTKVVGGAYNSQLILVTTSLVFLLTFLGQTHMASKTKSMLEKMETDALINGLGIFTLGQLDPDEIKEQLSFILGNTELFPMKDTEIVKKLTIACAEGKQFQPNLLAVTNYMTSNVLCDASMKMTSLKNTAAFSIGNLFVSSSTIAFMLYILLYYFTGDEKYKRHANGLKVTSPKKGGKKNGKKSRKQSSRKMKKSRTTKKRKTALKR